MTDVARDMTVEAAPPLHRPGLTPPVLPAASLPQHVAVVMDGNGRWANARACPAPRATGWGRPICSTSPPAPSRSVSKS